MNQTVPATGVKVKAQFPPKAAPLFQPAIYKVMHGGRGGSKSWNFCRALLILGMNRPLTILCTREIQQSIDESVYRLLCNQIEAMGFAAFYTPMDMEIVGANGTRFVFAGLKNQFTKIKSYEAIDVCAVFEADRISDPAWETLLPTIRRDPPYGPFGQGSEVWIEFNPRLATDATYKRWVLEPPEGSVVIEINYWDNPWFPQILRKQMEDAKSKDNNRYLNVWCGKTAKAIAGAIYAKEIESAFLSDPPRISPHVRYDKRLPVTVTFDLGRQDICALWFTQQIGMDHVAIDYYGNTGYDFSHYLDVIEERKYRYGQVILPHDARHKVISAKHSVQYQAQEAYPNRVRVLPPTPAVVRINAVRALFPRLWFAEGPTQEGVQALQHYHYGVNEETGQRTKDPVHDWASHASNSLEHYALSLRNDLKEDSEQDEFGNMVASDTMDIQTISTSWMR